MRQKGRRRGNRALAVDYRTLLVNTGGRGDAGESDAASSNGSTREDGPPGADGVTFADDVRADLVYMDPPYTSDNYSRFYHVLEVLTAYDYPPLARGSDGRILRGRYPEISNRFRSGFCRRRDVEREFERVIAASAHSGSKLVISYGAPNGLLLRAYRARDPECDPVEELRRLCERYYADVAVRRKPLLHSGQGDSNITTDEILVICRSPRQRQGEAARPAL